MFEVYVAITEEVAVVVQLGANDMVEFQKALQRNGMERVHGALVALDALNAGASVPSDRDMILGDIEATVGVEQFNKRVQESMRTEYKKIATSAVR